MDVVLKLEETGLFSLKEEKNYLKIKMKSLLVILFNFKGDVIAKNIEQEFKI